MATRIRNLTVYKKAFAFAMDNYHVSKKFSKDELYFLTTKKILKSINGQVFRLPTAD